MFIISTGFRIFLILKAANLFLLIVYSCISTIMDQLQYITIFTYALKVKIHEKH